MRSSQPLVAKLQASVISIALLIFCSPAHARVTLAVLPFRDLGQETNSSKWQYMLPFLLKTQLARIPQIRVLGNTSLQFAPDEWLQFAYREASPMHGSPADLIREIGRILEADLVICGDYENKGSNWTVKAWAMDVHKGKYSPVVSAASFDVFTALCEARKQLLEQLRIGEAGQEAELDKLPTDSFVALDLLGSAFADVCWSRPLPDIEQKLRRVLAMDSSCSLARAMLALALTVEGRLLEAAEQAKKAISNRPDLASAHYILGTVYLTRAVQAWEKDTEDPESERMAEREFTEAGQLAPDQPEVLLSLARLARIQGHNRRAMLLLRRADELEFYDPRIHEEMAIIYVDSRNREQALVELRAAERFDSGTEARSLLSLAQICDALHLTQKAVHYYERFVAGAERVGMDESGLPEMKQHLEELKARLTPHFVTAGPPESFTPAALRSAIRQKLGKVDGPLPENPFDETPEMAQWAHRIVGTNADEMTKAKLLFEAMTRRIAGNQWREQRTAEQTFNEWTNAQAKFSCEDYTFLYVCLARDVGLKAFFVDVTKDDSGDPVAHACPGVFIGGKAVLVDPITDWFGAPHQEYAFEDDLEATALLWSQSEDLALDQYAVKLAPRLPVVHFQLAMALAEDGQTNRAREEFQVGLALPNKLWAEPAFEGQLQLFEGNASGAVEQFKKCLSLHPDWPTLHYLLAQAYEALGDLRGARQEYHTFVERGDDPNLVPDARQQISDLDAKLKCLELPAAKPSEVSRSGPAAGSETSGYKPESSP